MRKIQLIHKLAPGDVCVLTGLVRDIAAAHPGKFQISVDTSAMDLWRHNPHIVQFNPKEKNVEYVKIQYGKGLRDQNYEPVHFLAYFHRDFYSRCKVNIPLSLPYPDLHLSEFERTTPIVNGRYWVVLSGGKSDYPIKVWNAAKMQEVVYMLQSHGLGAVQIGSTDGGHWHPPLDGTLNLIGRTNLRDMIRLIHHADGVICGVTCAMHMAAALQRPCVVIGGGREAWWWEGYVRENKGLSPVADKLRIPHRYLHTIGLLDCCENHGCWKNKVVKIGEDNSVCKYPIIYPGQPVPRCMDMITSTHVMDAVMKYYEDKSLPPIAPVSHDRLPAPICEVFSTTSSTTGRPRPRIDLFADPSPEVATAPLVVSPQSTAAAILTPTPATSRTFRSTMTTTTATGQHRATIAIPQSALLQLAANAAMEGRGDTKQAATAPRGSQLSTEELYNHPDVGGKFTIFVLLYGPAEFAELHRQCIDAVIATIPRKHFDLRIGSNSLNAASVAYVDDLVSRGLVTKHYRHTENAYKYPVMREMFNDPDCPITTKWLMWFDDDSVANRTPDWLKHLCQAIVSHHRSDNAHMFGAPFSFTMPPKMQKLFASRPWFKNRQWRLQNGKPSPNGNKSLFCTGGWWLLSTEAMRTCMIPDLGTGLAHNGGDVQIGEQLYQGGYTIKAWNAQKQFVNTSSVPRRGVTTPMPGSK